MNSWIKHTDEGDTWYFLQLTETLHGEVTCDEGHWRIVIVSSPEDKVTTLAAVHQSINHQDILVAANLLYNSYLLDLVKALTEQAEDVLSASTYDIDP